MYGQAPTPEIAVSQHHYPDQYYQMGATQSLPSADSGVFIDPEQSTAENLSEALGELRIDETGIGEFADCACSMTMDFLANSSFCSTIH